MKELLKTVPYLYKTGHHDNLDIPAIFPYPCSHIFPKDFSLNLKTSVCASCWGYSVEEDNRNQYKTLCCRRVYNLITKINNRTANNKWGSQHMKDC